VLKACGIDIDADPRLRPHPNGATAMRAMAGQKGGNPIGSTQITEILPIDGVETIGMLPGEFELATVYTVGIPKSCKRRSEAETLAALLTGDYAKDLRPAAGFGI
jgi:molybdate transport system substrate-binding protein